MLLPLDCRGTHSSDRTSRRSQPKYWASRRFADVGDPGRLAGEEHLSRDSLSRRKVGRRALLRVPPRRRLRDQLLRFLVVKHDAEIVQVEPPHHALGDDPVELLRVQGAGDGGRHLRDRPKVLDAGFEARLRLLAGADRVAQRRHGPLQPAGDRLRERLQRAFALLERVPVPGRHLFPQPLHGTDHVPLEQQVAAERQDRFPRRRAGEKHPVAPAGPDRQHGDQEGEGEDPSPEKRKYRAPTLHGEKVIMISRRGNVEFPVDQKTIPIAKLHSPEDSPGRRSSFHP